MKKCRLCNSNIANRHPRQFYCGSCSQKVYRLSRVFVSLKERCTNPKHRSYRFYKQLSIDPAWRKDTLAFVKWAVSHGWRPGLQIDRIRNDLGYRPSNCRFVTPSQNCRNKRNNVTNWEVKTRRCSRCGQVKRFSQFYSDSHEIGGLSYRCKVCQKGIDHARWTKQKLPGRGYCLGRFKNAM